MKRRHLVMVGLVLAVAASPAPAEERTGPWEPLGFLVGEWTGEESAVFGDGNGTRTYRMILGDRFLHSDNHSSFPPQERLPEGDEHRDWTIWSFDEGHDTYVVHQFNSEGFINRLVLDPDSEVPKRMVFVSESSQGAPEGLRVRLTLERVGDAEMAETFEMARPGKDFAVLIRTRWHKKTGR